MTHLLKILLTVIMAITMATPGLLTAQEDAPPAADEAPVIDPDSLDDDLVVMRLNGEPLHVWQLRAMVEHRAAPTLAAAAEMWKQIQLKVAEARRRGLADSRENAFILELYRDFFLSSSILDAALAEDVTPPTEAKIRAFYDENLPRYQRPMNATVQHITIREGGRSLAEQVLAMAREDGADFNELVTAYSQADDKNRQGQIRGGMQVLQQRLGDAAAAAIATANNGAVQGPFVGPRGFEVVLVNNVQPDSVVPFEQVREAIENELKGQGQRTLYEAMMAELEDSATVEKSAELEALEAEAASAGGPPMH